MDTLDAFHAEIRRAMSGDRHRLRRQLRGLQDARKAGKPFDRNLTGFEEELKRSVATREGPASAGYPSRGSMPTCRSPPAREEIAETLRKHQVVVICGETGSGKSTQLPKICP